MNKIILQGTEYSLPSCWEEVNLEKFLKIIEINDENLSNLKKLLKFISILTDIDEKVLRQVNLDQINQIDISFMNKSFDEKINKTISINGVKYGMVKELDKLSLGEYADLEELATNKEQDSNKNLHKIAAILMRPVIDEDGDLYTIEKYDWETVEQRASIFLKEMNVAQLFGVSNFFLNSDNGSLSSSNLSSLLNQVENRKTRRKIAKEMKKDLGDGLG